MKNSILFLSIIFLFPMVNYAQTEFADVIIDAFYSGANAAFDDFYGTNGIGCDEFLIDPSVCLGDSPAFVALPRGSYVTECLFIG